MKLQTTLATRILSLCAAATIATLMAAPAATRYEKAKYTEFKGTMTATIANNKNWNQTYSKNYDVVAWVYDNGNLFVFCPKSTYLEGAPFINTALDSWQGTFLQKNVSGGTSMDRLYTFKRSEPSRSADPFYFAANTVQSKGAPTGFTGNLFTWSNNLFMCDISTNATVYVTKSKKGVVSIICNPPGATSSSLISAQDLLPRFFGGFVKSIGMSLK